jgi:hypothetical protein
MSHYPQSMSLDQTPALPYTRAAAFQVGKYAIELPLYRLEAIIYAE